MIVIHNMQVVSVLTAIVVALLIWFGTSRQPFYAAAGFIQKLVKSPRHLIFFLTMAVILMINKYELKLETVLPAARDLTSTLTGWEGSWQGDLQRLVGSPWLTLLCATFYLVVFQGFMISSLVVYTHSRNYKVYYGLCVALLLNYLVAVPFYLFVPVHEAWSVTPHIRFMMLDVFPSFESQYRHLSGLDNCFPSLHTSISVTMALVASRSGNKKWAIFGWINATIIVFSIFYLGIHWFTDMLAGLVLAAIAATVGLRVGAYAERKTLASEQKKTASSNNAASLAPTRSAGS